MRFKGDVMGTPIRVTDDQGNVYMVDPALLFDPNEQVMPDGTLQPTLDGQIYQKADGQWYRVLRTDRVSWMSDIRPTIGQRRPQQLNFMLGRAQGYS
jgi:hypothetical protein